jgi:hypothetical protein
MKGNIETNVLVVKTVADSVVSVNHHMRAKRTRELPTKEKA